MRWPEGFASRSTCAPLASASPPLRKQKEQNVGHKLKGIRTGTVVIEGEHTDHRNGPRSNNRFLKFALGFITVSK